MGREIGAAAGSAPARRGEGGLVPDRCYLYQQHISWGEKIVIAKYCRYTSILSDSNLRWTKALTAA